MNKKHLSSNFIVIFLLVAVLAMPLLSGFVGATITVPSTTYLVMPTLDSMFNFASEQTFSVVYRELYSNASYPEFWFLTTEAGATYGFQGTANFTITTFFSGSILAFSTTGLGVIKFYTETLGAPISVTGATYTYSAVTKVTTVSVLSATSVTVSWVSPPPTPPPTAVTLTVTLPSATTYSSGNIPVQLSAVGGTITSITYNIKNGSSYVYPTSLTYTEPIMLHGFVNGSYILLATAVNSEGKSDSKSVSFSVSIPSPSPSPTNPTLTLIQPANRTYVSDVIPVELTSNGNAVWFNVKNGSNWVYSYNHSYVAGMHLSGFVDGTYTFYAFATSSSGGNTTANVMFTVDITVPSPILPTIDNQPFWIFLMEGNFFGLAQAYLVHTFFNLETAIGLIAFLFFIPLYLRTKSLLLLCILWIMVGGFVIAVFPLASGIAVIFMVLGIGGLIYRLFRPSGYG